MTRGSVCVQLLGVWYRTEVMYDTDEVMRILLSLDAEGKVEMTLSSSVSVLHQLIILNNSNMSTG